MSWSEHPAPTSVDEAYRAADLDGSPLAALARPRHVPRPSLARAPRAQRPHAEGPHLRADRRAARRAHDLAARDARGRAELGLPVHLDPGLDAGPLGLDTLGFDWEADDFFCFIADVAERSDDLQIMYGIDGEKDLSEELFRTCRATELPPGAHRQRRVRPAPARRVGRVARLGVHPRHVAATVWTNGCGRSSRASSRRRSSTGVSPTAGSGRSAASRSTSLVEGHVLGRRGPRREAGPAARAARGGRALAAGGRRDEG